MGNSSAVIRDGFNDKIVNGFQNDLIEPTQQFINQIEKIRNTIMLIIKLLYNITN